MVALGIQYKKPFSEEIYRKVNDLESFTWEGGHILEFGEHVSLSHIMSAFSSQKEQNHSEHRAHQHKNKAW
jgi:hypothetical protein